MKHAVEALMSGAMLLVRGEDVVVRGARSIWFRFTDKYPDAFDHADHPDVLMAPILLADMERGLTSRGHLDQTERGCTELRYIVRPEGPDMVSVIYTVIDRPAG